MGYVQGKLEIDLSGQNGTVSNSLDAERIVKFLVDSAGFDPNDNFVSLDLNNPGWILENITPFDYSEHSVCSSFEIRFDPKTTNDLVNQGAARYDENGN